MNNKERILTNTVYLYVRSIVALILRLYTSRLVLQALGVEDFGVYQAVGGLVAMTSFLNSTLSVASNRFIAYEIGKGSKENVNKVFSILVTIHAALALFVLLIVETVGLYFLHTSLDIGSMSISNANWVLHFSALSLVLTITSVPYNSMLIAKEDMSYFAYIDIFGEVLKLAVALALSFFTSERVVLYAIFMFLQAFVIRMLYTYVCHKNYEEARFHLVWEWKLVKQIASFSGWTSLAAFTSMIKTQGVTLIVNIFIGPLLNAAVGIANQVNSAVRTFSTNFQMAFVPQITKSYSVQEFDKMNKLTTSGAKLSTYLMIAFSLPLILECDYILSLWLVDVPKYASEIVILILIETICQTMTCTGNTAIRATGKVAKYEVVYNVCELLALPIMLIWMKQSAMYYVPFVTMIVIIVVANVIKVLFLQKQIPKFNIKDYVLNIFVGCPIMAVVTYFVSMCVRRYIEQGFMRLIVITMLCEIVFLGMIRTLGLNTQEKEILNNMIYKIKGKWKS